MTLRSWSQPDRNGEDLFRLTCTSATAWRSMKIIYQKLIMPRMITQTAWLTSKKTIAFTLISPRWATSLSEDSIKCSVSPTMCLWMTGRTMKQKAKVPIFSRPFFLWQTWQQWTKEYSRTFKDLSSRLWVWCFHKLENAIFANSLNSKSFALNNQRLTSNVTAVFARCLKPFITKFNINILLSISKRFHAMKRLSDALSTIMLVYSMPGHLKTK